MPTSPESIQVWVVCLANHTAESWQSVLSGSEWEKAMRFRMPADQIRCAVTRGVLKTLLARYLNLPAAQIELTQNEHGKPALGAGRVEFNVSHSGDYSLLAFSQESPLGIDVERIRGDRVVGELAPRVLSPAEYARFLSLAEADRKQTFFQIWTLKESVLKGIGSGLSVPPESLEIAFYPDKPKLLTAPAKEIADTSEWTLQTLSVGHADYAAAIAVKHKTPSIEITRFESHSPDST
jgi:4'-phosphopantetheinyl transferase